MSRPRLGIVGCGAVANLHLMVVDETGLVGMVTLENLTLTPPERSHSGTATERVADLAGDAFEIRIAVDRDQVRRKRFGCAEPPSVRD